MCTHKHSYMHCKRSHSQEIERKRESLCCCFEGNEANCKTSRTKGIRYQCIFKPFVQINSVEKYTLYSISTAYLGELGKDYNLFINIP